MTTSVEAGGYILGVAGWKHITSFNITWTGLTEDSETDQATTTSSCASDLFATSGSKTITVARSAGNDGSGCSTAWSAA